MYLVITQHFKNPGRYLCFVTVWNLIPKASLAFNRHQKIGGTCLSPNLIESQHITGREYGIVRVRWQITAESKGALLVSPLFRPSFALA